MQDVFQICLPISGGFSLTRRRFATNSIHFNISFILIISVLLEAKKDIHPVGFDIDKDDPDVLFERFNKELAELREMISI